MSADISRRGFAFGGALCGLMLVAGPAPAASGRRTLELFRGADRIGQQALSVRREGARVEVAIEIAIDVRVIGLPVYRYALDVRETWTDGMLTTLDAAADDNGAAHFARAQREGTELVIAGSAYEGALGGAPATTSYWAPAFLSRRVWISTQDGRPLNIEARRRGAVAIPTATGGSVEATRWDIAGDLGGLSLYYDAAGEWLGNAFEARGETARFLVAERGADLTPLWIDG